MQKKNYRFVKSDELMHYGVLGMRWGVHRAKVNKQKSIKAKKAGKVGLAKVYDQKAKYISAKHRTRVGSEKAYDRIRNTKPGKLAAQTLALGSYGALNYHRMRAKGNSKAASAVTSAIVGNYSRLVNPGYSIGEPRGTSYRVSKQNRKNKAMNVKLAKADYKKAKQDYKKQKKYDKAFDKWSKADDKEFEQLVNLTSNPTRRNKKKLEKLTAKTDRLEKKMDSLRPTPAQSSKKKKKIKR